jgi:RNA polymerase sigma-70 factor (ECF subfamily)
VAKNKKEEVARLLVESMPRIVRAAYALTTHSRTEADDIVQETCERVLRNWHQWAGEYFHTWVNRIVCSQVRRENEREAYRRGTDDDVTLIADPSAYAKLEAILARKDLVDAWPMLSLDHRKVVFLIDVEEYSYAEAAESLDLPIGTIMSRITRARLAYRRHLKDMEG